MRHAEAAPSCTIGGPRAPANDAVQVMSADPYRLARDIRGIGFKTADQIAMRLETQRTALIRIRAGISHALAAASNRNARKG
jgi:ATP-dependent exoDNAse (exonuclease V) alpha subunit